MNPEEKLQELAKKEQKGRTKKQRLVAAISEGVLDFADAKIQIAEINSVLEDIAARRKALSELVGQSMDFGDLEVDRAEFDQWDPDAQREFLQTAVDRITIYENYLIITYPFPRTPDLSREARVNLPPRKAGYIRL